MSKLTKNQKLVAEKIEAGKAYSLKEASALVKEITTTKFDASVDIDVPIYCQFNGFLFSVFIQIHPEILCFIRPVKHKLYIVCVGICLGKFAQLVG